MTLQETGELMEVLSAAYPQFYAKQGSSQKAKALALWAEMLKEYPGQLVAYAVKAFIASDTKGFPPVIGQILEKVQLLTGPEQISESEAWAMVHKAICRSGYYSKEEFGKLPPSVQQAVHSPEQLRAWATDPEFNAGVESSNFKRVYRMVCEREKKFNVLPEDVKKIMQENPTKLIE